MEVDKDVIEQAHNNVEALRWTSDEIIDDKYKASKYRENRKENILSNILLEDMKDKLNEEKAVTSKLLKDLMCRRRSGVELTATVEFYSGVLFGLEKALGMF